MADIVTIILIIVTAIAAAVPIVVFILQRQRKTLEYDILSVSPLLTGNELQGRVTIQFDHNREVQNIYLLILKLINSGNFPITATDFEGPIKIQFDKDNEVLSAEVTEKNPLNLDPKLKAIRDGLALDPLLLNSGDYIIIKALLTSYSGEIQINGRIAGVKDIQKIKEPSFPIYMAFGGLVISLTGLLFIFVLGQIFLGPSLLLIGYIMVIYGAALRRKSKKNVNDDSDKKTISIILQ